MINEALFVRMPNLIGNSIKYLSSQFLAGREIGGWDETIEEKKNVGYSGFGLHLEKVKKVDDENDGNTILQLSSIKNMRVLFFKNGSTTTAAFFQL